MHAADLNLTYSIQGLDLVELRAVWACLPETFENDGDDRKAGWKEKVLTRLKEMVTKDEAGNLPKSQVRASCYGADPNATGPFDADAPLVPVAAMQGNAFKQGVDADELQKLCSTGGGLALRRSSLAIPNELGGAENGTGGSGGGVDGGAGNSAADSNGSSDGQPVGKREWPPPRKKGSARRPASSLRWNARRPRVRRWSCSAGATAR